MSGNTEHKTGGPSIPVILLVHREKANLLKQSYENVIVINSADGSAAEFFQAGIEQHKMEGIYGFLSEHDYLAQEDSIERIVEALGNPYVGAVYSDGVLMAYNNVPQIFPSFSRDIYNASVINTPLFVGSNILLPWDTSLKTAYFFDYFKALGGRTLLAHIPQPLIATQWHQASAEEIKLVSEKYA